MAILSSSLGARVGAPRVRGRLWLSRMRVFERGRYGCLLHSFAGQTPTCHPEGRRAVSSRALLHYESRPMVAVNPLHPSRPFNRGAVDPSRTERSCLISEWTTTVWRSVTVAWRSGRQPFRTGASGANVQRSPHFRPSCRVEPMRVCSVYALGWWFGARCDRLLRTHLVRPSGVRGGCRRRRACASWDG